MELSACRPETVFRAVEKGAVNGVKGRSEGLFLIYLTDFRAPNPHAFCHGKRLTGVVCMRGMPHGGVERVSFCKRKPRPWLRNVKTPA